MGGASTAGVWLLEQGPEALRARRNGQGIRSAIASDFNNAMLLCPRRHWQQRHRPEWFFKEV